MKKLKVKATAVYEKEFPADWCEEQILFHLNERGNGDDILQSDLKEIIDFIEISEAFELDSEIELPLVNFELVK